MSESHSTALNQETRRHIDAARGVWTRRLIDFSRTNSLLFFRDLKVGTLDLTDETTAVDRLLAGEKLQVDALCVASRLPQSSDPATRARAEAELRQRTQGALLALQRKALSNLEEKGIETLHFAVGLASWPAVDGGRPYASPVLLLPARIESRGRGGQDLRLSIVGEPRINPVLLHVLAENHAIRIDGAAVMAACAGEDDAGQWRIEPEAVFGRIIQDAATIQGFAITPRVILANFQFAKMAMVEDLKRNGELIASSSIVAAIAGHSLSRETLAAPRGEISPAELDERPASDDFLVLDADSTQHRAIVLVGMGQSGVIQGPPGTGKSQTISNLIAQSVASGRRVLFVAEKRAALDAVIKRLSHPDVGLGHLVLDLHGASVSRKEVMARLANALQQIRTADAANGVEGVHREFEARRKQLNDHARRVNMVRSPAGLSINQMIGRLLKLPASARSTLRLRSGPLEALTPERADEIRQCLREGASHPSLLLRTDSSPWIHADITDGLRAQEAADLSVKAATELAPHFGEHLSEVIRALGLRPPATLDEAGELVGLLKSIRQLRERYKPGIFTSAPGELARSLEPAARGALARCWAAISNGPYRAARHRLIELRTSPASAATLHKEALAAESLRARWRAAGAASDSPTECGREAQLEASLIALTEAVSALGDIVKGEAFGSMSLNAMRARLQALADDRHTAYRLAGVHDLRARLHAMGFERFLDDLRTRGTDPELWIPRFEFIWLHSALDQALATDPSLAAFSGKTQEQIIAEFVRLDRERIRLAAARVRRLHAERAISAMNSHFDQANLVRSEANKKSRHISVRDLLARAPDVLTRITPCWVASPLSVSQLLDGDRRHFDIVVFDEASQILQEEAIPALYRAEQVVVAGDRHQLPPTTFFATAVEGEDELDDDDIDTRDAMATATEAISGYESLLDTLNAFLPNWLLEWHYRSEDERLISFSNEHIYSGRLVTFPSARGHDAIRHTLVPHDPALGAQEESASREVEEVVRQVLAHAESRPHESLGVITMGIKHANRVQAALDRALEDRPELSDFFSLDRDERFFVKNLETVQGDERDAIILTIGYGKSANGDLPHRFGPLTQEVGYRRLNVAITRAKRRMGVISSFSHHEVDLERSGSRGVRLLKAYLEYAASGGQRLPTEEIAGEVGLNAFEADIRDALEGRGIKVRPQFGASRYRIDLVAMHPTKPGRPVLAIECDGASYHSSATARDRDRLRQSNLERLGWRFHRIWSTDWFYRREQEIERAVEAFHEAVRRADLLDTDGAMPRNTATNDRVDRANRPDQPEPANHTVTPVSTPSARVRGPAPRIPSRESIDQYSERELRTIAVWIQSDGLLRTDEELIRDLFEVLPFQRLGPRIRERLESVARSLRER
ncbi:MAG: DUF4011 domain-containing protein [Phycisphaeraceae bacterium]|nr:DUF4011 domain-containing protein [Phycisphaeraceae bacterium]